MKKYFLIAVSLTLIVGLLGCQRPGVDENADTAVIEKKPFYVETATVEELKQSSAINKNGILIGANTVTVTAQIGGRVNAIQAKIGDTVSQGSQVVTMSDSAGSASFGLERASVSLEQARINYESTLLSLDQQIDETRRSIRQSQLQQQSAQIQANNAQLEGSSSAKLQLQQLEQQRNTAQLDLNTKIQSDEQTINNFVNNAKNILRNAQLLYQDVMNETDSILGVSSLNKSQNDEFEDYISARNTGLRFTAQSQLRQLLNQEDVLDGIVLTQQSLSSDLMYIQDVIQDLSPFLQLMEDVLINSTTGRGLTETQLAGFSQLINGLQSQVQSQSSAITQQVNTIESFLTSYKDQQQSIRESIDRLEIQIQSTRENLKAAERSSGIGLDTAGIGIESAQARLDDLIQTREVTQKSLSNAIRQGEIALRESQTNAGKFTVEAPIRGSIGEFLVDVGQEVSPGTPLFTITSTTDLEIQIGLTSNEVDLVSEGQRVIITNDGNEFGGVVTSITRTANQSLSYKATIVPDETPKLLGGVVGVLIPLESNQLLLPLKNIQIVTTDTGRITTYQNSMIQSIVVRLGPIQGANIVIDEQLDDSLKIVTSSVRTFDPDKFEVVMKNSE